MLNLAKISKYKMKKYKHILKKCILGAWLWLTLRGWTEESILDPALFTLNKGEIWRKS